MKILITGGSGFVGRNLVRFFSRHHEVTYSYLRSSISMAANSKGVPIRLDIREESETRTAIERAVPEAVIHVAGNKNVRYCEANPDDALAVNALGVRNVARACRSVGARMVYLSTDLTFDCVSGGYAETDKPEPTSVYGRTKLEGEHFALTESVGAAVCRSGGIYGPESPLLSWAANELKSGREIPCLTNVKNSPTYIDNLAEMIETILNRSLGGIFHTVGATTVNRYEFFRTFAAAFELDASLLVPIESADMMRELLLQPNAALRSDWTNNYLGVRSLSLEEGMRALRSTGTL